MFSTVYQHSKNIQERINRLRCGTESESSMDNNDSDNNNDENNHAPEPSQTVPMEDNESNEQMNFLNQENESLKQQLKERDIIIKEKEIENKDLKLQIKVGLQEAYLSRIAYQIDRISIG